MSPEALASEAKTRVTVEHMMRLLRPTEAVISRDGKRIAFSVLESFTQPEKPAQGRIWTTTADGNPKRATRGPGTDALPRWSPDGRTLAFASDRDHAGRLSVYVLGGVGEASPLGDIPGSIEEIQWSRDGERLLVLAADLGSDRAGAQTATKILEKGAPPADPKVTRPQQFWRRLYRIDVTSGETTEVSPPSINVWEYDWLGDSDAVAIVSDEPSESAWYAASVAALDLDDRSVRPLYTPEWQVAVPRIAPDGDQVAFVEGFCSDRGILAGTTTVLKVESGETRELAPEFDVSWLQWRDESALWYAGWRGMSSMCGLLSLDGTVEEIWSGEASLGNRYQPRISAASDGRSLVAVKEAPTEPPEAVVLDLDRAEEGWRPLSSLNAELAALELQGWERFSWQARDGLEIEGLLVRPRGREDERLPLVVLVHGGPTASWSYAFSGYVHPQLLVDAGYAVLMPNPRGSAGRGQEFARMNLGDMGGGDLQDILSGVDALVEAEIADGDRVAVQGGSYGGFMSAWAITQTDRFAAAVPMACCSNWLSFHNTTNIGRFDELFLAADPYEPGDAYFTRSPVVHARKAKTPTLIVHGELDLCTPVGQALELYQALADVGVEVELVLYPREGHGIQEWEHQIDFWQRIIAWFDRHLGGES